MTYLSSKNHLVNIKLLSSEFQKNKTTHNLADYISKVNKILRHQSLDINVAFYWLKAPNFVDVMRIGSNQQYDSERIVRMMGVPFEPELSAFDQVTELAAASTFYVPLTFKTDTICAVLGVEALNSARNFRTVRNIAKLVKLTIDTLEENYVERLISKLWNSFQIPGKSPESHFLFTLKELITKSSVLYPIAKATLISND